MPQPAWLDAAGEAQTALRLETPAGVELRQALYVGSELLLLLRDYQQRTERAPDLHWLVRIAGDEHTVQRIALPGDALPTRLTGGRGNSHVSLLCWPRAAKPVPSGPEDPAAPAAELEPALRYSLANPQFAYYPAADSGTVPEDGAIAGPGFAIAAQELIPVATGPESATYLRPFAGASVEQGLVIARCDWEAGAQFWHLGAKAGPQPVADPAILAAPDGKQAAGLRPGLGTPNSGAVWELFLWSEGRGLASKLLVALPVAAGALPDDMLSLGWLNPGELAVCLPQFAGDGQLNWRLLVVDAKSRALSLVADHLPPRSQVVALDGCLFYCRQDPATRHWELWAASSDGLTQRLLYRVEGAQSFSIADAAAGRLLLNRQSFGADGSSLHNALIELALTPLEQWQVATAGLRSPLALDSIDLTDDGLPGLLGPSEPEAEFIPDAPGTGGGAADRYKRRDGAGGGQQPPDLSLPGL